MGLTCLQVPPDHIIPELPLPEVLPNISPAAAVAFNNVSSDVVVNDAVSVPDVSCVKNRFCKCYGFDPTCWTETGNTWMKHISEYRMCEDWSKRKCIIPVDRQHTNDTTGRQRKKIHTRQPWKIADSTGENCCNKEICLHESTEHGKIEVSWWACYNEQYAEH